MSQGKQAANATLIYQLQVETINSVWHLLGRAQSKVDFPQSTFHKQREAGFHVSMPTSVDGKRRIREGSVFCLGGINFFFFFLLNSAQNISISVWPSFIQPATMSSQTQSSCHQQSIRGRSWHQSGWRTSFLLVSHSWQKNQWQETQTQSHSGSSVTHPSLSPSLQLSFSQWSQFTDPLMRMNTLSVLDPAGLMGCIIPGHMEVMEGEIGEELQDQTTL